MENLDFNIEHWQDKKCPPVNCRKKTCECGLEKVFLSSALGDDSKDSPVAPKNGAYCNAIVVYEANNHIYIYSKEGIPTLVEAGGGDVEEIIEQLEEQLAQEILDRQAADNTLQGEIDDLKNSPDVVDIVQDYAALQAYDTSKLGDNDIIRVLEDETHDGDSTYYRWDKQAETWTYIGKIDLSSAIFFYADPDETGDTRHIYKDETFTEAATIQDVLDAVAKGQVILRKITNSSVPRRLRYEDSYLTRVNIADPTRPDPYCWLFFLGYDSYHDYLGRSLSDSSFAYTEHEFQGKLTAGSNITISGDTISATDTTYSAFVGTDGVDPGTAGLVPAPATTDAGKFLKADGTWDTAGGGGPTVVQTTGTSTTDVMSQKVSSEILYGEGAPSKKIALVNSSVNERISPSSGQYNRIGDYSVLLAADWTNAAGNWNVIIGGSNGGHLGPSSPKLNLHGCVAIGYNAINDYNGSVSLGSFSQTSSVGEVNIGSSNTNFGYNNTNYRLISGVHDPVDTHDAATKNYVDANVNPTMFYAPFDIYQSQAGNVSIYLDESLTQAATGGDFYDAMAKYGQIIICAPPSYVDSDYHKIVSVSVHQPYEKSVTAFDSYPPEAYFAVIAGTGFASATLGFNSADVDDTVFSYYVNIS